MPESKTRKAAESKARARREVALAESRAEKARRTRGPGNRAWVPPLFIAVGLLGVAWIVVYYLAGIRVPYMQDWGNWNMLIGMGLIAAAFALMTLWK